MTLTNFTAEDLRAHIMEGGFYPENIPPVYRVRNFHQACTQGGLFGSFQVDRNAPLSLSRYNASKRGGKRRNFSFSNPIPYLDLADFISTNRAEIQSLISVSNFSYSKPKFDPSEINRLYLTTYSEFSRERKKILAESKYVVKTDISRFYHSIYTHSIPWAMHGKKEAKQNRKIFSQLIWGNTIDYLVRQAQDQQTIGLPVGPDTSRIIAELVCAAIDAEFLSRVGNNVPAARLVDDAFFGANTLDEAESLLQAYQASVQAYELDLSEAKSTIVSARVDIEDFWPVRIRRELERYQQGVSRTLKADLTVFLDEIFRTANDLRDDAVVRFAIRKMDDAGLWVGYWDELEPYLIKCALNFPHALDYVARVVSWRHRLIGVDVARWRRVLTACLAYHSSLGNDSEVCWALWLLKELGQKLDLTISDKIIAKCGPLSVLIVMDLAETNLIDGRFRRTPVYERLDDSPILGGDWIISYEAERLYGYKIKTKNRKNYGVIGELIARDVSFYDRAATPLVFAAAEGNAPTEALERRIGSYEEDEVDDEQDVDLF